jgi:nitroreductase
MNPKLQTIFARRSVRVFMDDLVDEALIRAVLEAGMAAPSAMALDPWNFYVIRAESQRKALANALPNGQMLRTAPVAIVVAGDMERVYDRALSYLLQDCSACIENALLAASMLGLGTCWVSLHPNEERMKLAREMCGMPATFTPVAIIAMGWPGEKTEPRTRYRDEAVHYL